MDFVCQNNFFKNPTKLPLNELHFEAEICKPTKNVPKDKNLEKIKDDLSKYYNVKIEKILALDPFWIAKHHLYYKYQPYYSECSKDENNLFLSRNKPFLENLNFLLWCTYHQFWNYVIYEPSVVKTLRSFITNPVPWYEIKHLEDEFLNLYMEIFNKIAAVYLRLITFKESDQEYMHEAVVMQYLKGHKILTYTDIMCLCLLYNRRDQDLINRLNKVFFCDKEKTHYNEELKKIFEHSLLAFEMVGGQVCGFNENGVLPSIIIRTKPVKFDPYWLEEVCTYVLDMGASLNAFLSNCSPACELALKMGLPFRLSYFYNNVYSTLYTMLQKAPANVFFDCGKLKKRIFYYVGMGRREFINTFHIFVMHLIDKIIEALSHHEKQEKFFEIYLKLITVSLEDEFFIFDYHNSHPIDVQIQTITDFYPELDHMRSNYILECLGILPSFEFLRNNKLKEKCSQQSTSPARASSIISSEIKTKPNVDEIEEIIKCVLDTLPYLGDGFILQCLEAFDYNPVDVISAVLDDNLPPHLSNVARDLIRVPPEPQPKNPILAYRGKKPDHKDAGALLNDKSDNQDVKDFVLKSSISFHLYDDEYDDRDDVEPTLKFYDRNDEESHYKYMGNRYEGYDLVSDPSESSSSEEDNLKLKDAFCKNPAELRAKKEAFRRTYQRYRNCDVTGKSKGEGQAKNVVKNREKKTVNKSSRGNHNRRGGAQWKRSKGMIPS